MRSKVRVKMSKLLYVVGASLVLSAPAFAQSVAEPQAIPVPLPPAKSDVNKIICERQEEMGSRLKGKKVCMTLEQWQQYRAENREKTERLQGSAGTRPSG
jgi:hypothetical protein